mmetsp:Transcript_86685/g.271235  ORF Transcript_86685/g.271235 Transcript_86685/m.271235 type:complete len:236 (+) Transcript_86685:147-854(+)
MGLLSGSGVCRNHCWSMAFTHSSRLIRSGPLVPRTASPPAGVPAALAPRLLPASSEAAPASGSAASALPAPAAAGAMSVVSGWQSRVQYSRASAPSHRPSYFKISSSSVYGLPSSGSSLLSESPCSPAAAVRPGSKARSASGALLVAEQRSSWSSAATPLSRPLEKPPPLSSGAAASLWPLWLHPRQRPTVVRLPERPYPPPRLPGAAASSTGKPSNCPPLLALASPPSLPVLVG